jgi:hypothetical protein
VKKELTDMDVQTDVKLTDHLQMHHNVHKPTAKTKGSSQLITVMLRPPTVSQ